ncbi:MAG: pilus assembly protein [Deltaproteobacteria bacterium]|nr:pilus assembly protein [Deltaproteobacteria bacterium]
MTVGARIAQFRTSTLGACERGVAIIEAAIALPASILIVVLMIDTGQMLHTQHVLSQITNDALLYGVSLPNFDVSQTQDPISNVTVNLAKVRVHTERLIALDTRLRLVAAPGVVPTYDTTTRTITVTVQGTYSALFPVFGDRVVTARGEAGYKF